MCGQGDLSPQTDSSPTLLDTEMPTTYLQKNLSIFLANVNLFLTTMQKNSEHPNSILYAGYAFVEFCFVKLY